MHDRLDVEFSRNGAQGLAIFCAGLAANAPDWNFSRYQANVVVINLGTNDVGHGVSGAQWLFVVAKVDERIR